MDKNNSKIKQSNGEYLLTDTAVDIFFNGWFLMKTSQVSTREVSFLSRAKKDFGCVKIAVQFFSLQTGYPVRGFCNELIPSKYNFMKNALMMTTCIGNPRLSLFSTQEDTMYTTLLT
jgi:hypothetical protein